MRTQIDGAGRVVIPKALRDALGMIGGSEVEIEEYGGVIQVRPLGGHARLEQRDGRTVAVGSGAIITDDMVRALRDADRR
jgi:AbrB family looped-hinge helix DNA binding protein